VLLEVARGPAVVLRVPLEAAVKGHRRTICVMAAALHLDALCVLPPSVWFP
jgi:hypothetical protein